MYWKACILLASVIVIETKVTLQIVSYLHVEALMTKLRPDRPTDLTVVYSNQPTKHEEADTRIIRLSSTV